jgi:glycosyltransferase involved in cell wall biosynthesis
LLELFWRLPVEWLRAPGLISTFAWKVFVWKPRYWMNYWENLYGAGIAVVLAGDFRRNGIQHVHAVWASLPAMAAWLIAELTRTSFSVGAHAYDLYDHDGDHFLKEKCLAARFVHTSTIAGMERLKEIGIPAEHVLLVRRGLDSFPVCRPLRENRNPLRIVCVARLVEKKGVPQQFAIYRSLVDAGMGFSARIIGDGPLAETLREAIEQAGLSERVELVGSASNEQVWGELAEADVLFHTGVVTESGDRDGLPNVVPEAMASGVIVISAPAPGVEEAIENERTGFVCNLEDHEAWKQAIERVRDDSELCELIRINARRWVEEKFDATRNASLILKRFHSAIEPDVDRD